MSPTEDADLRPALREFPELRGDYWKIRRPTGDVDLLIGIQDARLHPYLANPAEHCKGNLRLLTSMFGTGYLIDGSHPEIKVEPCHLSSGATERTRGSFSFVKQRGFKRRPRISHHSQVTMFKTQECMEPELMSKGRPSGGFYFSDISASSEAEVVCGVSRVVPSWDSSPPPTTTCNQGHNG